MTTENIAALGGIAEQATERLDHVREQVRDEIDVVDRRLRSLIDEYPLATVLGAVAVGYFVARLGNRL